MFRTLLIPAVLTGVFCAGFAGLIDITTDMLDRGYVVGFAFVSGFLGSVFARAVLGKRKG